MFKSQFIASFTQADKLCINLSNSFVLILQMRLIFQPINPPFFVSALKTSFDLTRSRNRLSIPARLCSFMILRMRRFIKEIVLLRLHNSQLQSVSRTTIYINIKQLSCWNMYISKKGAESKLCNLMLWVGVVVTP